MFMILVALFSLANGAPSKGSTKASLKKKTTCAKDCGDNYKPICAGDGTRNISFGSECVLSNYNCENQKGIKFMQPVSKSPILTNSGLQNDVDKISRVTEIFKINFFIRNSAENAVQSKSWKSTISNETPCILWRHHMYNYRDGYKRNCIFPSWQNWKFFQILICHFSEFRI